MTNDLLQKNISGHREEAFRVTDRIAVDRISRSMRHLFEPEVVCLAMPAAFVPDLLFAEELSVLEGSILSRKAEFAAARILARNALNQLGFAPMPLQPHPDRSPRWPSDAIGSLSHTGGICGVVAARLGRIVSLGLDIELMESVAVCLDKEICTIAERSWLQRMPQARRTNALAVLFSAKEAFYKCQYPINNSVLDFLDVSIDLQWSSQSYTVFSEKKCVSKLLDRHSFEGRFAIDENFVLTSATLFQSRKLHLK